jgi:hypothetical protein
MPRGKKTAKVMPVIYFPVDAFNERLGEARSLVDGVAKYFEDYGIDLFTEKNPNIVSVIAKRMRGIHAGLNDILNDAVIQTMTEYIDRFEEMGIRDNWRHFMNNRKAQSTGRPAFDYSVWSTWVCPREWRKAASAKASK